MFDKARRERSSNERFPGKSRKDYVGSCLLWLCRGQEWSDGRSSCSLELFRVELQRPEPKVNRFKKQQNTRRLA